MYKLKKNIGQLKVGGFIITHDSSQSYIDNVIKLRPEIITNFDEIKIKNKDGRKREQSGKES